MRFPKFKARRGGEEAQEPDYLDHDALKAPDADPKKTRSGNLVWASIITGRSTDDLEHRWASGYSELFSLIAYEGFHGYDVEDDGMIAGRVATQYPIDGDGRSAFNRLFREEPYTTYDSRFNNVVIGYPIGPSQALVWLRHALAIEEGYEQPGDLAYQDEGVTGVIGNSVARVLE